MMSGATFFFCSLILATLFASQVQAGWEMLSPEYGALRDVARRQTPSDDQGPRIIIDAGYGEISYTSTWPHPTSADIVPSTDRFLMDWMLQGDRPTSSHGCYIRHHTGSGYGRNMRQFRWVCIRMSGIGGWLTHL